MSATESMALYIEFTINNINWDFLTKYIFTASKRLR